MRTGLQQFGSILQDCLGSQSPTGVWYPAKDPWTNLAPSQPKRNEAEVVGVTVMTVMGSVSHHGTREAPTFLVALWCESSPFGDLWARMTDTRTQHTELTGEVNPPVHPAVSKTTNAQRWRNSLLSLLAGVSPVSSQLWPSCSLGAH